MKMDRHGRVARATVDYSIDKRVNRIVEDLSKDYIGNKKAILSLLTYALSEMDLEQLIEQYELPEDFEKNNEILCPICESELEHENYPCKACYETALMQNNWEEVEED